MKKKASGGGHSVRRKLLAEATRLFNRRGYASTSVREIVAAAGVTKPVLYHYFGSKEGLYLEIMKDFIERFNSVLEEFQRRKESARERILRLSDVMFVLCQERIESVRLMYSSYYGPPQGAPAVDFDCLYARVFEAIRKTIEEGMRAGEFRRGDASEMAWVPLGVMTVALEGELAPTGLRIGHKGLLRILDHTFSGIAAQKGKGKGHVPQRRTSHPPTVVSCRGSGRNELLTKRR